MYIAMNRFKVLKDATKEFENVWFSRESYLHELPGFVSFHLLKGPEREDHVLYSSHTVWRSHADFDGSIEVGHPTHVVRYGEIPVLMLNAIFWRSRWIGSRH